MYNLVMWLIWGPVRAVMLRISLGRILQLSRLAGWLTYVVLPRRRKRLKDEYARMFPEKSDREIQKILLAYFRLRVLIEIQETLCAQMNADNINRFIRIRNKGFLEDSLDRGKGVILATFHFGPHLQIMPALGHRHYKINQVAMEWLEDQQTQTSKTSPGVMARKVHQKRLDASGRNFPSRMIPLGRKSSVRPLFRCLGKNEILILAMDGRKVGKWLELPFFHHRTYRFDRGPVNLALHTGASVHPVFVVKHPDGTNELIIEHRVEIEPQQNKEETIAYNTRKIVEVLTRYVTEYPCHYGNHMVYEMEMLNRLHLP